jgi:hypothetical protein
MMGMAGITIRTLIKWSIMHSILGHVLKLCRGLDVWLLN